MESLRSVMLCSVGYTTVALLAQSWKYTKKIKKKLVRLSEEDSITEWWPESWLSLVEDGFEKWAREAYQKHHEKQQV